MLVGLVLITVNVQAIPFLLVTSSDGSTADNGRIHRYNGLNGSFDRILGSPLPDDQINGLVVGPDGNLYASAFDTGPNTNGRILKYDLNTGALLETFVPAGTGGIFSPLELIFGADGDLYVVNNQVGSDNILRFDGMTGAPKGIFATGLTTPQDLVFGPDGNLYVSNGNSSVSSVFRFDGLTGAFIDEFITSGLGGLNGPSGLAFGPDGNLYVASGFTNSIFRYDGISGALIDEFISSGSGGLLGPTDITFGPDDALYANSRVAGSVVPGGIAGAVRRYDSVTGSFLGNFVDAGSGGLGLPKRGLIFVNAEIPEPTTLALVALGIAGLGFRRKAE